MARASTIDLITVGNYRCFREQQVARLAPLTLLVGENSTGKTSFLALIRALWDLAAIETVPDFNDYPYDLGAFHEVVHHRGTRGAAADSFEAGFSYASGVIFPRSAAPRMLSFQVTFSEQDGAPFPTVRRVTQADAWLQLHQTDKQHLAVTFGASDDSWAMPEDLSPLPIREELVPIKSMHWQVRNLSSKSREQDSRDRNHNWPQIDMLMFFLHELGSHQLFASAPVRSRPRRTYDPMRRSRDPEGEYIPTYLEAISRRTNQEWQELQRRLETFGRDSGLFDEIAMNSLARRDGSPFQVQVKKYARSTKLKGPARNLVDVGYGVSQALPILTEILRDDAPDLCLLQQPEVHLHPTTQAALGTLFCSTASSMQLIVETHSDHLIDRVRMDIRDKKTDLRAEDVSILFFEPNDLDVTIHSLRLDDNGNVLDAPPTYRQFFMTEMQRSLGL